MYYADNVNLDAVEKRQAERELIWSWEEAGRKRAQIELGRLRIKIIVDN